MGPGSCYREAQEENHPNSVRDEGEVGGEGFPQTVCGFLEDKDFCTN